MKVTEEYLLALISRLATEEQAFRQQAAAKAGARQACEHVLERMCAPPEPAAPAAPDGETAADFVSVLNKVGSGRPKDQIT